MTQDISIAHHGATEAKAGARRAELADKDQAEGFGARALAVLFVGFAIYLKSFFTASQAENMDYAADGPGSVPALPGPVKDYLAASSQAVSLTEQGGETSNRGSGRDMALEGSAGQSGVVAPGAAFPTAEGGAFGPHGGRGPGRLDHDQQRADATFGETGTNLHVARAESLPGRGLPGETGSGPSGTTSQSGSAPSGDENGTADTPGTGPDNPDAAGPYDFASLFQDLGATLLHPPDSVVVRVTDLAIGDLMRDVTLQEFHAYLGPLPQNPSRPLETLISVLTDAGARDAFVTHAGLTGLQPDAVPAPTDALDMIHQPNGAEPSAGPDLFL